MPRPALSKFTIAALKTEIERRTGKLDALKAQRDALDRQIAELEGIAGEAPKAEKPAGGARKAGKKRRPKPKIKRATGRPLAEYVREVLAAAPKGLSVKEIEKAVLAAGYPTTAKTLYFQIMKVLGKVGVKKLGWGVYAVKGKPGRKPGKLAAKAAAPAAKAPARRGTFSQTGDQMILGLLEGGKALTTAEINAVWKMEGRGGKADVNLSLLVKAGKLKRESVEGQKGSRYSLA